MNGPPVIGLAAAGRKVRLGPIEQQILADCDETGWVGARLFMGWRGPYPHTQINRLVAKGLIEVRWMVMTLEERRAQEEAAKTEFVDVLDHNGAIRLTEEGRRVAEPYMAARKLELVRELEEAEAGVKAFNDALDAGMSEEDAYALFKM